ncbi:hypothetical protein E2C01_025471 [Portunus trituberculatus]|uniref:Uncharacterized protein n=1 Tax=Portunus trituberculatus TaxID=210409 RepID=A0A5B7EFL9_PORTR|nr:hypothetical protein [Portunus trituberculatus]
MSLSCSFIHPIPASLPHADCLVFLSFRLLASQFAVEILVLLTHAWSPPLHLFTLVSPPRRLTLVPTTESSKSFLSLPTSSYPCRPSPPPLTVYREAQRCPAKEWRTNGSSHGAGTSNQRRRPTPPASPAAPLIVASAQRWASTKSHLWE